VATRKKTTAKKTAKATVKRSVAKKSTSKSNFWKIEFSINTVYWIAIGVAVIAAAAISYNTNMQVNNIYDKIDEAAVSNQ